MKLTRRIRCTGVIVRDHHILLILHRQRLDGQARWIAPGGGLEPNESEEACVQREMKEETGLEVRVDRMLFDERLDGHDSVYQQFKTYLCSVVGGDLAPGAEPEFSPGEGYDIAAAEWFDLRQEMAWPQSLRDDHMMYPFLRRVRMVLGYEADVQSELGQCQWPSLSPRYRRALYETIVYIWQQFDGIQGILVSGTIIRGQPDDSSDFDIFVIHEHAWRQRVQRRFHGVPAEIFINPPGQIRRYFQEEHASRRPMTAHMLATGFTLFARNGVLEELVQDAHHWLDQDKEMPADRLTFLRYAAATRFEDATDMAERDPATAQLLLAEAVLLMLRYGYARAGHYEPRAKELLTAYGDIDERVTGLARQLFESADLASRLSVARLIAADTISATGFFEWESPIEPLNE